MNNYEQMRTVYQCNECYKMFVSLRGLQTHGIVHTGQKPYQCEVCAKAFRFKSNLSEHRSLHSGTTPHSCPYCGKSSRLKGNLKKHLRKHFHSKEELDVAWQPFSCNRRPPSEIPHDAVVVRSGGGVDSDYVTPTRPPPLERTDPRCWMEKLRSDEQPSFDNLPHKISAFTKRVENYANLADSEEDFLAVLEDLGIDVIPCPFCSKRFSSHALCASHISGAPVGHDLPVDAASGQSRFCEKCLRCFESADALATHNTYHHLVVEMLESGTLEVAAAVQNFLISI